MRVVILGAGPAGLYAGYLLRREQLASEVRIIERNAPDSTFGFGVVFSDRALEFLARDDPDTHALIAPELETWQDITLNHQGQAIRIDGIGFSAIGRLRLLQLLQSQVRKAGIEAEFGRSVQALEELGSYDLLIGADGVNSLVRASADFGESLTHFTNRYVWYGTSRRFPTLTQTFHRTSLGSFNAHHYRYSGAMSTFIAEVDAHTFFAAGFERMSESASRACLEDVFGPELGGHPLLSNRTHWRRFPRLAVARWSVGNKVLIGDALHTAHFSIGSGTRLALEDALALVRALADSPGDLDRALVTYERERRPVVEKLLEAADASARWYENFASHLNLDPWDFALSYALRSGRMDLSRLSNISPGFARALERAGRLSAGAPGRVSDERAASGAKPVDLVSDRLPCALEIGFSVPGSYNASEILFRNLESGRREKTALYTASGNLTYGELSALAGKFGNGLTSLGLTKGDRILMLMDDTPFYPAAFFGAVRAGFVPILCNTLSTPDLVRFYLEDSAARAAVIDAGFGGLFDAPIVAGTSLESLILVHGRCPATTPLETYDTREWLPAFSPDLPPAASHRDDMAFWMYSSGSTGKPKGIVHLQHDMAYTMQSYGKQVLGIREDDIAFSVPKIFFAYGFGNSITFPFSAGAGTLLHAGRPDPAAIFDCVERFRPTLFFGLPTLYNAMLAHPRAGTADFSSVRLCISAAEVLSPELFDGWKRRFGIEIMEGLGSTEVLHIYLSNTRGEKRIGAVGKRVPGYEIRLTSPEGRLVAKGDSGVLWVRGGSSAPCYWNRPEKTRETMREGWIRTGDLLEEDENGFYTFAGRVDDLIKVSGQWVYPLEIERTLSEHAMVRECAVLGREMSDRRMTLQAFVVLEPGHTAGDATTSVLQSYVKSKLLPYKYPRTIVYLDALPKTGTGKIDRQQLRERTSLPETSRPLK